MRVLQHRGRDLAKIQGLAGWAADPHYDQIITPEARLSQDRILGCDIETKGRSDRCVKMVCQLDDVLEDGFLVAPARRWPSQAALCSTEPDRAHDIESRHRVGAGSRQSECHLGAATRDFVAADRHQDVQVAPRWFLQMRAPRHGHREGALEPGGHPGNLLVESAVGCRRPLDADHQEIVSLSRLFGHDRVRRE